MRTWDSAARLTRYVKIKGVCCPSRSYGKSCLTPSIDKRGRKVSSRWRRALLSRPDRRLHSTRLRTTLLARSVYVCFFVFAFFICARPHLIGIYSSRSSRSSSCQFEPLRTVLQRRSRAWKRTREKLFASIKGEAWGNAQFYETDVIVNARAKYLNAITFSPRLMVDAHNASGWIRLGQFSVSWRCFCSLFRNHLLECKNCWEKNSCEKKNKVTWIWGTM